MKHMHDGILIGCYIIQIYINQKIWSWLTFELEYLARKAQTFWGKKYINIHEREGFHLKLNYTQMLVARRVIYDKVSSIK